MDHSDLRSQLERFHGESYGWALRCCAQDPLEAQEVVQTAYLKVLDGRARYQGLAAFKTWLLAVIRRTAADERRRHVLRRLWLVKFGQRAEPPEPPESPDATAERTQLQALFRQALAGLPRRQREVLQLVFYHDLTLSEAALAMEVSVGSARTHYERGKAHLRQAPSPEERQRALQQKVEKVQEGVQRWQDEGRDPSPVAEIMQELEPLMKTGKLKQAEALLAKALKLLGEGK
ncbi:MAG: RNA polymerase sigma factor [Verrucomicrobia bacterium]|nr:RNA polymerase sigma factor [Verrucomicrobiota bacterium]